MLRWVYDWWSPQNPAYSRDDDDEARASLHSPQDDRTPAKMADSGAPSGERSRSRGETPGERKETPTRGRESPQKGRGSPSKGSKQGSMEQEEVIEPVIVKSTATPSDALYSPRRGSYNRLDDAKRDSQDIPYKKNTLWNIDQQKPEPESRSPSAMSNSSKKSVIEHQDQPDEFPWQPKRKQSSFDTIDLEDPSVITTHDLSDRRRSSAVPTPAADKPPSRWEKIKIWWLNLEEKMQDNRVNTPEEKRELILLDQQQDSQYRKVKKTLNVVFLLAGFVLLLAVIVHIINTDPQFKETMKALTVFLAGRRQGIW